MRNEVLLTVLSFALTGCATSSAGLYRTSVETTVSSSKTSQKFATCVAETLQGNNPLRNEGDHYWVLRMNGYGVPIIRWDFMPKLSGGSIAELRTTLNFLSAGTTKVQACAGN
ncbi:MAG: hypothetical protein V4444_08145 [Pseudomonadota bacterium]